MMDEYRMADNQVTGRMKEQREIMKNYYNQRKEVLNSLTKLKILNFRKGNRL